MSMNVRWLRDRCNQSKEDGPSRKRNRIEKKVDGNQNENKNIRPQKDKASQYHFEESQILRALFRPFLCHHPFIEKKKKEEKEKENEKEEKKTRKTFAYFMEPMTDLWRLMPR